MQELEFINLQKGKWQELEKSIKQYKKKDKRDTVLIFKMLDLYNDACGHLSYIRTYHPSSVAFGYLNRLVSDAHGIIYTKKTSKLKELLYFFIYEVPRLFRENIIFFIVSASFFLLGFIISFFAVVINPENAYLFLDSTYIEASKSGFGGNNITGGLSAIMSSFVMTNNINVGINALALGITGGIGTIYVLWANSSMLGALSALAFNTSQNLIYWSLILPHGFLELFAIFVCGAAGLLIGFGILVPGRYSIKDSVILAVKKALKLAIGMIPIFVVAGLIEGFITPSGIPSVIKVVFAFFTIIPLIFYLCLKDKRKNKIFH